MTPVNALGSGQAQVLAAVVRCAHAGPVSIVDIAHDLDLRTSTVRQHLTRLAGWGLVHPHVDERHVTPLVRPLSLEQAARTRPPSALSGRMAGTTNGPGDAANVPGPCPETSARRP